MTWWTRMLNKSSHIIYRRSIKGCLNIKTPKHHKIGNVIYYGTGNYAPCHVYLQCTTFWDISRSLFIWLLAKNKGIIRTFTLVNWPHAQNKTSEIYNRLRYTLYLWLLLSSSFHKYITLSTSRNLALNLGFHHTYCPCMFKSNFLFTQHRMKDKLHANQHKSITT